jgi:carbamoyl-phosphate synthase small subunit
MMKALLILIDGTTYEGTCTGQPGTCTGEVVFNTSMTGYQEILTDPSYAGQLVALTYPLIGNYGVNDEDSESIHPQVAGFIVKEMCETPSNYRSEAGGDEYLRRHNIVGIQGVDVRSLVKKLREVGVMMGMITTEHSREKGLEILRALPDYDSGTYAREVSTARPYQWQAGDRDLEVVVLPCSSSPEEILAWHPDGVMLSNGPGDPKSLEDEVQNIRTLQQEEPEMPIFGICLGHQLLGRALGGETYKLKFGHRGANHPVKDLTTGRVHITTQNHGYAVQADTLPPEVEVTHLNLNDNTVEGLRHKEKPIFSVQYHPEASPGPKDNAYLFDKFAELVKGRKRK